MSLRDFFIAPPPADEPPPERRPHRDRRHRRPPRAHAGANRIFAPPSAAAYDIDAEPAARDPAAERDGDAAAPTGLVGGFVPPVAWPRHPRPPLDTTPPARDAAARKPAPLDLAGPAPPRREIVGAAVLGRPGEAEPLAAAIALVLRRLTAARAATVVVVGADDTPPAGAASRAARRLAARLSAHGFEHVGERGRLAWVHTSPEAAPRATIVGAPAVLAVTIPLTPDLEATITEQELVVVVTAEPDGALAELARAALEHPHIDVISSRPLPRGIPRALTRAGLTAPRAARKLL